MPHERKSQMAETARWLGATPLDAEGEPIPTDKELDMDAVCNLRDQIVQALDNPHVVHFQVVENNPLNAEVLRNMLSESMRERVEIIVSPTSARMCD